MREGAKARRQPIFVLVRAYEFARKSVPAHSIGICVIKLWV